MKYGMCVKYLKQEGTTDGMDKGGCYQQMKKDADRIFRQKKDGG